MNPEIEKLIELALADGQITEKERNVILNKAISLGIDQDEVEMIIEGRLHQLKGIQPKPAKEKVGNIKTCPACGASVKSMTSACEDCGQEFANIEANKSITGLYNRINSLQKDVNEKEKVFNERKAEMINNTAIPNTKEDLIDFLVLCSTQANVAFANRGYSKVISAWSRKGNEAVSKAKILFKNNIESMALVDKFEKKLKFGKLLSYLTVRNIIILLIIIRLIWMNLF
jgi:hypothetical protein